MKKYLLCIAYLSFCFQGISQHIADANFAQGIRYQCSSCIDAADNLTDNAQKLTGLTVSILNISDLTGIEGFSALSSLNCTNNNLTALPDKLPIGLKYLNVSYNKITQFKSLPAGLTRFYCIGNGLLALPELPISLQILDCSYNKITVLPQLKNLTTLFCTNNLLTDLPLLPDRLDGLVCSYNQLKTLPKLPKPLIRISVQYNPDLKCLPLLPEGLVYLDISKNIVCLPNVVKNLAVDIYEGFVPTAVNLPICNNLRPPPCDTFPQTLPKDSTNIVDKIVEITLFPNPTEGEVVIKCQNCTIKKISVFNVVGQLVFETQMALLDFSGLGCGLYIVRVETVNGATLVEKIMRM